MCGLLYWVDTTTVELLHPRKKITVANNKTDFRIFIKSLLYSMQNAYLV
jgi:hypothetical protein